MRRAIDHHTGQWQIVRPSITSSMGNINSLEYATVFFNNKIIGWESLNDDCRAELPRVNMRQERLAHTYIHNYLNFKWPTGPTTPHTFPIQRLHVKYTCPSDSSGWQ